MCSKCLKCVMLFQLSVQLLNILRLRINDSNFPHFSKLCVILTWVGFVSWSSFGNVLTITRQKLEITDVLGIQECT